VKRGSRDEIDARCANRVNPRNSSFLQAVSDLTHLWTKRNSPPEGDQGSTPLAPRDAGT
jgi:hypothetical protein